MMRFDFIEIDVVQDDKGWEGGLLMYNQESDRSVSTLKESVYTHSLVGISAYTTWLHAHKGYYFIGSHT